MNTLYGEMAAQAGVDPQVDFKPLRPGELLRNCVDPSRAGIQLGWKPWTTLGDGTAAVLAFVRKRQAPAGGLNGAAGGPCGGRSRRGRGPALDSALRGTNLGWS